MLFTSEQILGRIRDGEQNAEKYEPFHIAVRDRIGMTRYPSFGGPLSNASDISAWCRVEGVEISLAETFLRDTLWIWNRHREERWSM